VEEELLLVDAQTGRPRSVAAQVLRVAAERHEAGVGATRGGSLDHEFQQEQVETDTSPQRDLLLLEDEVRLWRDRAIRGGRDAKALVLATGTSPFGGDPSQVRESRYDELADRFGLTASEQLTCGCHVHVSVESAEEAVGAMDRIRSWLPVLLALSANSPFWRGNDTSYASFRSQAMARWPSAGPSEVFGSEAAYRAHVAALLGTGVILDEGMLYGDVRPSYRYPTLEIRVADVCLDVRDTVLIAALCRALVETAAAEWRDGIPAVDTSVSVLRLATWQAGRFGMGSELLDPQTSTPKPADEVVDALLRHCDDALRRSGDRELATQRLADLRRRGNGADRQRTALARTGNLADVIAEIARVTAGQVD
jgi:carboxylate-amine ligase